MGKKWNTDKAPVENILSLYTLLLFNYKKYSLRELSDYLNVSKSTTLRYLDQLEKADFGKVLSEKKGRENLYYFERIHDLPKIALNPEALEQLAICHDFIMHLLPQSIHKNIDTLLQQITAYLPKGGFSQLHNGIHLNATPFSKGRIDYTDFHERFKILIKAIKNQEVCIITYKKRIHLKEEVFDFAPQKLISYNGAIYIRGWLVSDKGKVESLYDTPRDIVLHRVKLVETSIRKASSLPLVIENEIGAFGYMNHKAFIAKIHFDDEHAVTYISERIWSENQKITYNDDGSIILEISVRSKIEFISWILSYAESATVLEPKWIQEEIKQKAEFIGAKYKNK